MAQANRIPVLMLFVTGLILIWSAINPFDRFTWWLEVAPVLIVVPLLIGTYRRFRLTDLLYVLIAIHAAILMVGGHYTYANVPLFNLIQEWTGATRNSYDGVGHFAQGFIPAIVARELLLRTSTLSAGRWLAVIIVMGCLGISAIYEIIEWTVAAMTGDNAEEFLGTQGDPWDTQKDMALAGIGAIVAQLLLNRLHNLQLLKLKVSTSHV